MPVSTPGLPSKKILDTPPNIFYLWPTMNTTKRQVKKESPTRKETDDKAILSLVDIISLQRAALDEIDRIVSSPEDFFVKTRPSTFKEESPVTDTTEIKKEPKGQPLLSVSDALIVLTDLAKRMRNRGLFWDRLWNMVSTNPILAGSEKPRWPDEQVRQQLPPLTAPLIEEYKTRVRLMEKAFDLAFPAYKVGETGTEVRCIKVAYHAILRSLLEEAGLEPSKEQS